jgi:hypothetical protein
MQSVKDANKGNLHMSFRIKLLSLLLVQSLLLIGCSGSNSDEGFDVGDGSFDVGGGDFDGGGGTTTTDSSETSDETEGKTSDFSYNSLAVFEASKDFSGFDSDGLVQGERAYPYIHAFLINPIVASSLASTTRATADDYSFIVDDIEVDSTENFPILQKVIGTASFLDTALVFDVSGSVSDVDFAALIAEAKAYVAAAQASTDTLIANQRYVVWAFGKSIEELTDGFTSDIDAINGALDLVVLRRNENALGLQSNLHKAVVEAIGRYQDDTYDFRDSSTVELDNNDLIDSASSNGIALSQMVLFSSGTDTFLEIDQSLMIKAIKSQGFPKFEDSVKVYTNKPIIYYVIGGTSQGTSYSALSDESEETVFLTLRGGAYSFSSDLIQSQLDAVEARVDLSNQYIYRASFLPRVGDHTRVFKSNSPESESTLTTEVTAVGLLPYFNVGTPAEELTSMKVDYIDVAIEAADPADPNRFFFANGLIEITGPNGEYLSGFAASLSEVSTFLPATRWVSTEYSTSDYEWSFPGGDGVGTLNANGSYTVNSITGSTAVLQLENTVLGYTTLIDISN